MCVAFTLIDMYIHKLSQIYIKKENADQLQGN